MKRSFVCLFSLFLVFTCALGTGTAAQATEPIKKAEPVKKKKEKLPIAEVGKPAPEWSLPDVLDGKPLKLSDFAGKVVVLDIWATWCQPCRAEVPRLIELKKKYKSLGLEIVGISVDDNAAAVKPFLAEFHVNYPVVLSTQAVFDTYDKTAGLPRTYIIDRHGIIVKVHSIYNERTISEMEKEIKPLL